MAGEFSFEDVAASLEALEMAQGEQDADHQDAVQLRNRADRIDRKAEKKTRQAWTASRDLLLDATDPEPVDSRELLEAALSFAVAPIPESLREKPQRAPIARPPRQRSFTFLQKPKPVLDTTAALSLYDAMKEGEPVYAHNSQGVLAGRPNVSIHRHWRGEGIGVQLVASMFAIDEVGVRADTAEVVVKLEPEYMDHIRVGVDAITAYARKLKLTQSLDRCGHGNIETNLLTLQHERARLSLLAQGIEVDLDLSTLDKQIQRGTVLKELERSRRRLSHQHRSPRTYLRR